MAVPDRSGAATKVKLGYSKAEHGHGTRSWPVSAVSDSEGADLGHRDYYIDLADREHPKRIPHANKEMLVRGSGGKD